MSSRCVCVCVGMSRPSVCKTTTVEHALPLHGWTKTRRLRAVTVYLDRHTSLYAASDTAARTQSVVSSSSIPTGTASPPVSD